MTHVIDTVFIDAILSEVLRKLGLPETLPLIKLSPRMQEWIIAEAEVLQRDAMSHPTFALLVEYGYPLTRESYLNINNVDEEDLGSMRTHCTDDAVNARLEQTMAKIELYIQCQRKPPTLERALWRAVAAHGGSR